MKLKLVGVALAVTQLVGCAGMMHAQDTEKFNGAMTAGNYQQAADFALKESGYDAEKRSVNDLLWAIEAGAALNYAGNFELSTKVFDASEVSMKEEDQEGTVTAATETGLSLLGNDAMMAYEQTQYDGVMANTFKAWNFMFEGDYNNARVEWNRAEERQRRAAEFFAKQIKEQQQELEQSENEREKEAATYTAKTIDNEQTQKLLSQSGITFDKWKPYGGYVNPFTTYSYALNLMVNGKTSSDYKNAASALKRVQGLTNSSQVRGDIEIAEALAKGKKAADNMVWVIYENGESMVKEEVRVDLPLFIFSDDVLYTGMALPRLKARNAAFNHVAVNGVKTEVIADMDQIIGAEFEKGYNVILAREITRTILKTVAQKQLNDENAYLGLAASILQVATTNADTRSFTALPKQYQAAHVKRTGDTVEVTAGSHKIPVKLDTNADHHIIHVKATNALAAPLIRVINI